MFQSPPTRYNYYSYFPSAATVAPDPQRTSEFTRTSCRPAAWGKGRDPGWMVQWIGLAKLQVTRNHRKNHQEPIGNHRKPIGKNMIVYY